MGIWERPPQNFLDALQLEFGFNPPREHGLDAVDSIRALRDGKAHVFIGLGGNFVQAAPDTEVVMEAMRRARLTVHISTKLNRSHLVCGRTALILPTKGRTEMDVQASGEQWISVEDSTCSVHASRGPLPAGEPVPEIGGGDRLPDRRGHPGGPVRHQLAGHAGGLQRDPPPHLQGRSGLSSPTRSTCAGQAVS